MPASAMILDELAISTLAPGADFAPWTGFAYPMHARAVATGEFPWLATAARGSDGVPAGLALARLDADAKAAELLSVYVAPERRRRGLGSALLSRLADELAGRTSLERLSVRYSSRIAGFPAVEKTLARAGLGEPFDRIFMAHAHIGDMPPWAKGAADRATRSWRLLSWEKARAEGIDPFERGDRAGAPAHLAVRFRESEIDWPSSQILLSGGDAKGWLVTHRLAEKPDTLYYTKFWADPEFAAKHRIAGMLLLRAAIYAQSCAFARDGAPRYSDFDISLDYGVLLRSFNKHLLPYLRETWTHRGLEYALAARRTA
jgi:GNAT superfamily N-acetyltransferase